MRGGGRGGGGSANKYSCAHGAQLNFGDLTPYLTYGIHNTVLQDSTLLPMCSTSQIYTHEVQETPKSWTFAQGVRSLMDLVHASFFVQRKRASLG